MTVRPVQISIDTRLLERVDADPEARDKGRSAFVRSALTLYLKVKEQRDLEARIAAAYRGEPEAMLDEIEVLMDAQEWPPE